MAIAGGGTGGHLFPGIAVAEEFKRRDEESDVMFIGTESGIEASVIPKEGYPIKFLKVEGVLGRSPLKKAAALWKTLMSVFAARAIFRAARPDVVVGAGGYVSVGPVLAARTMSIPAVIMEQNLMPGLANRLLGRVVDAVAATYHESMAFFPRAKTHLVGNPIRQGVLRGDREEGLDLFSLKRGRVTIFIMGGSRGARRINNEMMNALAHLLDIRNRVQFLHQTGEEDYEAVRNRYREMGFEAMVVPFVFQMGEAYAVAEVLIARAGASTLAEFTALGKPAILVPYPHAGGHQEFNARKLQEMGGCMVISDKELSGAELAARIRELVESDGLRAEMRKQSRALGRPDAAQKVVDLAVSLVRARNGDV
jgi:UDP-N-acetylglucosamine--N-acetylmuramyl-(pentapeptide) pyrophosphoryl-undecaprenol N-acetylglucosamine transferase